MVVAVSLGIFSCRGVVLALGGIRRGASLVLSILLHQPSPLNCEVVQFFPTQILWIIISNCDEESHLRQETPTVCQTFNRMDLV